MQPVQAATCALSHWNTLLLMLANPDQCLVTSSSTLKVRQFPSRIGACTFGCTSIIQQACSCRSIQISLVHKKHPMSTYTLKNELIAETNPLLHHIKKLRFSGAFLFPYRDHHSSSVSYSRTPHMPKHNKKQLSANFNYAVCFYCHNN